MRDEKQFLLDEIKEKVDSAKSMIVLRYEKLPPNGSWELRDQLAKSGSLLEIVKKRVFLKAIEQNGIQIDEDALKGNVGVVFDKAPYPIASAKAIFQHSKENADSIEVLLGHIDGKVVSGSEVEYLSKLPGKDEMRAQFIALLVSPMSLMLSVVDAAMAGSEKKE